MLKVTIFDDITQLSKAMSDTNRVRIVALIQRENSLCVCQISDTLIIKQPLVSRHLKELKNAYIISSFKDKKWVIYTIIHSPSEFLNTFLSSLTQEEALLALLITCTKR